jgi:hypothetical protein
VKGQGLSETALQSWLTFITESPRSWPSRRSHARPYPGLNIDNLPFFVVIGTQAEGLYVDS